MWWVRAPSDSAQNDALHGGCKATRCPPPNLFFRPHWRILSLLRLCSQEPAPKIMRQNKSHTAHLTPQRSSPWPLQASLLLSGPAKLIVTLSTCRRLTRPFLKAFAQKSQYNLHINVGSANLKSLSCCPPACTNLRSACALQATAKQEKLPTCQ